MAKSTKKKNVAATNLQSDHPMARRKTVQTLENEEGEVIALDNANFGIHTSGTQTLLPLNLPSEMKRSGVKVKFSGQAKETELTEFWAGQPILLTKIEKLN